MIDPKIRLMYWLQFNEIMKPGKYPGTRDRGLVGLCAQIENECRARYGGVDREWAIEILLEWIIRDE